jgi:plasmid stabilization system protein ParE
VRSRPSLRKVVHRHYVVIYRLHEGAQIVEIVRVWDGRINPADLELP